MSEIKFKKILNEKDERVGKVELIVQRDRIPPVLVRLNPNEYLSKIRQELEKNSNILMEDIHLFAMKSNVIAREVEKYWKLSDIIEKRNNDMFLCLVKISTSNVRFLIDQFKLEYGRTITSSGIKVTGEKAFIIKETGCKLDEFGARSYGTTEYEFNSNESEVMKMVSYLSNNIDVRSSANFGKTKSTNSKYKVKSVFYNTVSLKLIREDLGQINYDYLKPTEKFLNKIEDAIESGNPRKKFKEITKEFGLFISNEVIFGGKFYSGRSQEKYINEIAISACCFALNINVKVKHNNVNSSKPHEFFKLIGGKQPNSLEKFDEKTWKESLNDFENWECTEYKNPVSIFRPLPYELRKRIFKIIGKRILYNSIEDYIYKPNKTNTFELPTYMADIVQNEDAECNIFATVIDTNDSKNDFFSCQILWTPNEKLKLIIHLIHKSFFKRPKYNLKIGLMVVGYNINFDLINIESSIQFKVIENKIEASKSMYCKKFFDDSFIEEPICLGIPVLRVFEPSLVIGHHFFNYQGSNGIGIGSYIFSYCLKKNHYVELPEFTFSTLIISNYPDCNEYRIIPFNCKNSIFDKLLPFNFKNSSLLPDDNNHHSSQPVIPKFISLHSNEDNCAPIFLKQKQNEIKIKYMRTEVCDDTCICKKALEVNDLKLHFFKVFIIIKFTCFIILLLL
jgi:hypothetical protein